MGRIWITGDTHGDVTRFEANYFPEQRNMSKDDVVIICGDFGLIWDYRFETTDEAYWLDWLNDRPFTTAFVDGNHENFSRLNNLREEERFGAPCGIVRDSVFWLKRGYVYHICGKKVFTFGGASSHDIQDGIVDPADYGGNWRSGAYEMESHGRFSYRVKDVSWWKDEVEQDPVVYQRGLDNLAREGNSVDLIITHCAPTNTAAAIGFCEEDTLTDYLQKIHDTVDFDRWYFGHYHKNIMALPHEYCLYREIVSL